MGHTLIIEMSEPILEFDEQIADIPGYEGSYVVTSFGYVWSLSRTIERSNSSQFIRGRKLRLHMWGKYLGVQLALNCSYEHLFIHRLVANAFIPNPDNLPEVNHLDTNKLNCRWDNLEWTTRLGNIQHAQLNKLHKKSTSIYIGVYYVSTPKQWRNPWRAGIRVNGRTVLIGYFPSELEAAQAYNAYVIEHGLPNLLNGFSVNHCPMDFA
jgi:hypothetical protein